jgi:hypothetical protein
MDAEQEKRPVLCHAQLFGGASAHWLSGARFLALQDSSNACWWCPRSASKRILGALQPNGCGKVDVTDTWVVVIYSCYCNTISHFFCFARLQVMLHDSTYAALGLSAILDQATQRLGYDWEYCTGNLGQHTTAGCQFYIRITNSANGRSVGYIYGRLCHWSFEAWMSAIIWALAFIDSCGYRIRDINYHAWMQMYGVEHSPPH